MFRCEGRIYQLLTFPGEGPRLVEATPEEVAQWREEHVATSGHVPSVVEPIAKVRACYEGPLLRRAHAVAALGAGTFLALFGQARKDPRYTHGRNLKRIGETIRRPSEGCGKCRDIAHACGLGCAQRIVYECLELAGFNVLVAASKHIEPAAQLEAATMAQMDAQMAWKERKPRRMSRRVGEWP